MTCSLIVAADKNGVIGNNNQLPWHIKEDLQFFKKTTINHAVIMGRQTLDSINGKPLPKRLNIVVSRTQRANRDNLYWATSIEKAICLAKEQGYEHIFIAGGDSLYTQALEANLIDDIYRTVVDIEAEGDRFFQFDESAWRCQSRKTIKNQSDICITFEHWSKR